MNDKKKFFSSAGITLVEMMLVLAIAATLIITGFYVFNRFQLQTRAYEVRTKVDQLFLAMKYYYQANCRTGTLSYSATAGPSITPNDLVAAGYLVNWHPLNPIVDDTAAGGGYTLKFNKLPETSTYVTACTEGIWNKTCTSLSSPQKLDGNPTSNPGSRNTLQTKVIRWEIQIAVKLRDGLDPLRYKNDLAATCVGDSADASCATPSASNGNFLIWARPTNYLVESGKSNLWPSMGLVKQFNLQYTNDGMAGLSGVLLVDQSSISNDVKVPTNFYVCGD